MVRLAWCGLGCAGGGTGLEEPRDVQLETEVVVDGLDQPIFLTQSQGDDRLFVVEQSGRVLTIVSGSRSATPFLDIRESVSSGGESGLLSVAFHPNFRVNNRLYMSFTARPGASLHSRVVEYTLAGRGSGVITNTRDVFSVEQPFANHNGGLIAFGPDAMLYVGLGDGGSGGDPLGNGQNLSTVLGAILRIDVDTPDAGRNYGIPAGNPFASDPPARGEIWIFGLRNPWRFAFDEVDGLLYVADVGQGALEEITVVPANRGGLNLGWNITEGSSCYEAKSCVLDGLELPALEYENTGPSGNCSVIGGYVYRGAALPQLQGHYFYSDFCGGFLRSFRYENGQVISERDWNIDVGNVTSFGRDAEGELYLLVTDGRVLKIVERRR